MKKTFKIDVDCANCAAKMERAIEAIPGVSSISIGFLTQKFKIEAEDERFDEIMAEAQKLCRKIERHSKIYME